MFDKMIFNPFTSQGNDILRLQDLTQNSSRGGTAIAWMRERFII
jgi:hypothetical protein